MLRGNPSDEKNVQAAVDYALVLVAGRDNFRELLELFPAALARQIRASALALNFTNRMGNTVDRWLFRLRHPRTVSEGHFMGDLIIAAIWLVGAVPLGAWALLRPSMRLQRASRGD